MEKLYLSDVAKVEYAYGFAHDGAWYTRRVY